MDRNASVHNEPVSVSNTIASTATDAAADKFLSNIISPSSWKSECSTASILSSIIGFNPIRGQPQHSSIFQWPLGLTGYTTVTQNHSDFSPSTTLKAAVPSTGPSTTNLYPGPTQGSSSILSTKSSSSTVDSSTTGNGNSNDCLVGSWIRNSPSPLQQKNILDFGVILPQFSWDRILQDTLLGDLQHKVEEIITQNVQALTVGAAVGAAVTVGIGVGIVTAYSIVTSMKYTIPYMGRKAYILTRTLWRVLHSSSMYILSPQRSHPDTSMMGGSTGSTPHHQEFHLSHNGSSHDCDKYNSTKDAQRLTPHIRRSERPTNSKNDQSSGEDEEKEPFQALQSHLDFGMSRVSLVTPANDFDLIPKVDKLFHQLIFLKGNARFNRWFLLDGSAQDGAQLNPYPLMEESYTQCCQCLEDITSALTKSSLTWRHVRTVTAYLVSGRCEASTFRKALKNFHHRNSQTGCDDIPIVSIRFVQRLEEDWQMIEVEAIAASQVKF